MIRRSRLFWPCLLSANLVLSLSCSSLGSALARPTGAVGRPATAGQPDRVLHLAAAGLPAVKGLPAHPADPFHGAGFAGTPFDLRQAITPVQHKLVEGAEQLLGRTRLSVRDRSFTLDCTGTVMAIYWHAGIDLSQEFHHYGGNGVNRLYRTLESYQLLYDTTLPAPGDLIFWDNTYDRNGDGKWNDPLTHVGMVLRSFPDGSVEYVHFNYRKGIVVEYLNLKDPDTHQVQVDGTLKIVNSPLRMRGSGRQSSGRWLASQLYRQFGMGYRLDF